MKIDDLHAHGYSVTAPLFSSVRLAELSAAFDAVAHAGAGTRELLGLDWCAALACELRAHPALHAVLGERVAVQCTGFEKSRERNWLVTLHQDLAIPVQGRVDDPALCGWSVKEGQCFVQPPAAVLESLVAVRVHLDDCGAEDGALAVVPGSHQYGRLDAAGANALRGAAGSVLCPVPAGAAMLMHPLTLHASSKATGASRRRVLHVLYGPPALPHGLAWARAV